ncbi:MAG: hypothetical protein KI790_16870 [Cyclobacteriaceae bacterium]|nr:hypothetical protein [Cyclobacteriaceae bacterium HetDA_MAG_MS6]
MSKKQKQNKPKVHKDLEGFDVKVDTFGELQSTFEIDKINQFLNKNVDDKKLRDREDIDQPHSDDH